MKNETKKKIKLCHTDTCCPTIRIHRGKIVIEDNGNKVVLTKKQWRMAVETVAKASLN